MTSVINFHFLFLVKVSPSGILIAKFKMLFFMEISGELVSQDPLHVTSFWRFGADTSMTSLFCLFDPRTISGIVFCFCARGFFSGFLGCFFFGDFSFACFPAFVFACVVFFGALSAPFSACVFCVALPFCACVVFFVASLALFFVRFCCCQLPSLPFANPYPYPYPYPYAFRLTPYPLRLPPYALRLTLRFTSNLVLTLIVALNVTP